MKKLAYCFKGTEYPGCRKEVSKYQLLEENHGSQIDTGPMCCKWCFNVLSPEKCKIILKPQKHPKSHMRSLLKKDVSRLNNFQRKLVDKIKNSKTENTLIFSCLICLKNTHIPLRKENRKPNNSEQDSTEIVTNLTRKKKKKKKDLFAGLNAQVVQNYKKLKPATHLLKKAAKEISFKHQLNIHRALVQTPVAKKKPSQLALFLENM